MGMQRPGPADFTGPEVRLLVACIEANSEMDFHAIDPNNVMINDHRIHMHDGYAMVVFPERIESGSFLVVPFNLSRMRQGEKTTVATEGGIQPEEFRPDVQLISFPSNTVRLEDISRVCE